MKDELLLAYNAMLAAAMDKKWLAVYSNKPAFEIYLYELECEFWDILIRRLL